MEHSIFLLLAIFCQENKSQKSLTKNFPPGCSSFRRLKMFLFFSMKLIPVMLIYFVFLLTDESFSLIRKHRWQLLIIKTKRQTPVYEKQIVSWRFVDTFWQYLLQKSEWIWMKSTRGPSLQCSFLENVWDVVCINFWFSSKHFFV